MKKLLAPLALVAVLTTSLSGCAIDIGNLLSGGAETPAGQNTSPAVTPSGQEFDANDVMFAQMMIVHHQQAVDIAGLAMTNTSNPAILDLASRISDAQQPEIETMTSWLESAGAPTSGHHMEMPGIVDDDTMSRLASSTDGAFDALFLVSMIQHHQGAIDMANDVLGITANDEVAALARGIIDSQTSEIEEMNLLLGP